ncbi:HepT-like ribonuclease domain-containing protein [Coleofasciculus sp.]|uniref:HepT-like ribonuclease domain-containing protein n=1 Tax=Coleofasciculus sp. TaxID=3100458 RepID=UPI003A18DEF1
MSVSAREYLQHILDETTYIITSSKGLDKTTFVQDETLKRAYVRSIEVIGEAVKQLPDTLRQNYTTIEWRAIAGMRDRLIHNYFGVDYDIVWDVVTSKVPELDTEIRNIIEQEYP